MTGQSFWIAFMLVAAAGMKFTNPEMKWWQCLLTGFVITSVLAAPIRGVAD